MDNKSIIKFSFIGGGILLLIILISNIISFSNQEVDLRNAFKQKFDERTSFYDKMWKTISQDSKVAIKNDSSFREIVNIQINGQKDGENVTWKWIQQSNPAATFTEVSALYKNLTRVIESERAGFFVQEKYMQDIVQQHSNLIQKFPGSFYNIFFNRKPLEYKPITSTRTDDVIKTGKDDNIEVF